MPQNNLERLAHIESLTHLAHIRAELVNNRNQIVKLELDERFLQRQRLKATIAPVGDVETKLAETQRRLKVAREIVAFLEEMESEYAEKTGGGSP